MPGKEMDGFIVAGDDEQEALRALAQALAAHSEASLLDPASGERLALPPSVVQAFKRGVAALASGRAVVVASVSQELTTQAAADLLNMSRPYLVKLLEQGAIPFTTVGTHRRLRLEDVLTYKKARDVRQLRAINEIAQMSQDAGLYD